MDAFLQSLAFRLGVGPEIILLAALGLGAGLVAIAVMSSLTRPNPAAIRIAHLHAEGRRQDAVASGLLRESVDTPRGLIRAFLPSKRKDRLKIEERLLQAGFTSPNALHRFTLFRGLAGLLLPAGATSLALLAQMPGTPVPGALVDLLGRLGQFGTFKLVVVLAGIGYLAPSFWLDSRIAARKRRLIEAFPNALDLLQVSLEAGLGFDAAMVRVGNEIAQASPDLAFELLSAQHEIQAGKPRDAALSDMARRTGVDVIRAFALVVEQSMQFGSSMSEALTTYAVDMRDARETRAQEQANKLPVKMSVALASLMLPALLLLSAGPSILRYIRFFGE